MVHHDEQTKAIIYKLYEVTCPQSVILEPKSARATFVSFYGNTEACYTTAYHSQKKLNLIKDGLF